MVEKAENIKRIMSSFLRMIGGRIKWVSGVLHLRNEDDTAYQDLSAGKADLDSVKLLNAARTAGITIKVDPSSVNYPLTLPANPPVVGDVLQLADNSGNTFWSPILSGVGVPVMEEMPMVYAQATYTLLFAPNARPVEAFINGLQVDFTILANTITITTYSTGDIESTDILRVFYYH